MLYPNQIIQTKYNTTCLFRSPVDEDAKAMLSFIKALSTETDNVLYYPEEIQLDEAAELSFLKAINQSPNSIMIVALVDGAIAGNCQIRYKDKLKNKHRAVVAIGLLKAFWGLGIATSLFEAMIVHAKAMGILQLELEVFEGNKRAIQLYEKMGFRVVAEIPNAIKYKDGRFEKELYMVKTL
ncbi:MAG: N-acetyltransferase [Tenericutes bacterium HGW-Tenericutes-8]|nr:MAG: N-acetyltransferase [Tenericutes bacterium HGW-Tenericutes-8]